MKKIWVVLLCIVLVFVGHIIPLVYKVINKNNFQEGIAFNDVNLSSSAFQENTKDQIYADLVEKLCERGYFVENISSNYISKEYVEELEYNTKENVYFGYSLSELDEFYRDTEYVFTVKDGETITVPFEAYENSFGKVIKNILIGAGVILFCVTVSAITYTSAPAISIIFAGAATSSITDGLIAGVVSGVAAGIITGIETGNIDNALKSAAVAGSEAFKLGAIAGALEGGLRKAVALKRATLRGLSMNEAAKIQRESGLPLDFLQYMHSMDEYEVYKSSNLSATRINGKYAFTQNIDWELTDSQGLTNIERVCAGNAPVDISGKPFELHHVGQKANSPLAILSNEQHHGNDRILHDKDIVSEIDRNAFNKEKKEFWAALLEIYLSTASVMANIFEINRLFMTRELSLLSF